MPHTRTLTVNIPPKTKITFYQRRYEFKIVVYFVSDSWGKEWKVGTSGGERCLTKECTMEIMSDDFLAQDTERLYNAAPGIMDKVCTVSQVGLQLYGGVKDRDCLTEKTKRTLYNMNI